VYYNVSIIIFFVTQLQNNHLGLTINTNSQQLPQTDNIQIMNKIIVDEYGVTLEVPNVLERVTRMRACTWKKNVK
jgi:hypothetical protein